MLKEIYIKHFALIDELRVQLNRGLTVLTGETGSGKSIIIDALSMCFGRRADNDFIRRGEEKSIIEIGLTSLPEKTAEQLEKLGIAYDGELVITRELHRDNSSVARLNGRMIPVSALKTIAPDLITIHGQNEYESLTQSKKQIEILDNYGKRELAQSKAAYKEAYSSYMELMAEMARIRDNKDVAQIEREMDLLKYQIGEIENAKLRAGELEELEEERKRQANAEKIHIRLQEAHSLLQGGQANILSFLDQAVEALQEIGSYDRRFSSWNGILSDAYYNIEDVAGELSSLKDSFQYDEGRLDEIFLRLDEIRKLYRKYGGTYEKTISYCEEMKKLLYEYRERDSLLESYRKQRETIENTLKERAEKLSEARKKVSRKLERSLVRELDSLSLKNVRFHIDIKTGEYSRKGFDEVLFMISFNAGEELKAFHKVASGGEVSRFMLALQNVLSSSDGIDTLIFDEIDTGVSGIAAGKIGEKLADIAQEKQVLCITHLPQIASFAQEHFLIEKVKSKESFTTRLRHLKEEQRVDELAKMTVGEELTEISLCNARELLEKNRRVR